MSAVPRSKSTPASSNSTCPDRSTSTWKNRKQDIEASALGLGDRVGMLTLGWRFPCFWFLIERLLWEVEQAMGVVGAGVEGEMEVLYLLVAVR